MKTKIYLFNNTCQNNGWDECIAIAETGELLANHICSSTWFMYGDLYGNRPERKRAWAEKYPDGYEVIELPEGQLPSQEVLANNEHFYTTKV